MSNFARIFLAVCIGLVVSISAAQAKRVALVIGNSAYENVARLKNPENDANAMAAALERMGFAVTRLLNADKSDMGTALLDFSDKATGAELAVVFYAGHGIEISKQNHLIPVDARLRKDLHVTFETISLDQVMAALDGVKGLKIVLLDACRDNPFAAKMAMTSGTRSIGRGLARVEPQGAMLIGFAAREGTTADDGDGDHSPYTQALLEHIEQPGLDVGFLFRKVRARVLDLTNGQQEPLRYGGLPSRATYLVGAAPSAQTNDDKAHKPKPSPTVQPAAPARNKLSAGEVWADVKNTRSQKVLRQFLKTYPEGIYSELARARLDDLKAETRKQANINPAPEMTPPPRRCLLGRVVGVRPISQYNRARGNGFLSVLTRPRSGQRLGELYRDDRVEVFRSRSGWYEVACLSGRCLRPIWGRPRPSGWVYGRYLRTFESTNCP